MKLISFDIGIRNMAFCIFDISGQGSPLSVSKWEIINLLEKTVATDTCSCLLESKSKKTAIKICGRKAVFKKNGDNYCQKHAIKQTDFFIPFPECSPSFLRKKNLEELLTIEKTYFPASNEKISKKALLEKLIKSFETKCFQPIVKKKEKTSNDTDLISIGKKMKQLLNEIESINEITHVIIENQISPIANRMKTVQGMLAQYFIMINSTIHIEFISSSNKLKNFIVKSDPKKKEGELEIKSMEKTENNYKTNKKNGILYCSEILEKNESLNPWQSILNTPKKDDLSDCFLQGIWYLQKKNIINCAEDLKINSI